MNWGSGMSKGLKSILAVLAFALLVCASALAGATEPGRFLQTSGKASLKNGPAAGISKKHSGGGVQETLDRSGLEPPGI